jgi:diadenylate cyclase
LYLQYLKNLADIAVVYYIVYRLILLLKGTRAMQVIWGVFILAVITAVSKYLHLEATVWLMQQFWLAGMFLLIVVFQPEIRFALANIGSNPLGRVMVSAEYRFIGEMMEAVRAAMEEKMGMLIVLEQDMALRDIVESGVRINAAVISNNRLVAAGCILPLTEQQELSKILGMRHRAALGLSEAADAIIVIVSEETGTLSVARNGKLQQRVDPKDLEAMLYQLYRSKAEKTLLRKSVRPEPAAPGAAPQPNTPPPQA